MKRTHVVFATALLLTLSGCSTVAPSSGISGSGSPTLEARAVPGFSIVELSGSGDVHIEQTGSQTLSIEAQPNLLPYLTTDVTGDTLRLGTRQGVNIHRTEPITYRVTVKDLAGLLITGSGAVYATRVATSSLTIAISGSGHITIDGTADHQDIAMSGSGNYDAENLASRDATARLSGSGSATVTVTATLQATLSGSGDLSYVGNPHVAGDSTGSGQLRQR